MESKAPPPSGVLRFGVFEADVRSGEVYRNGRRVHLQEQPFKVLVMLLERCGNVVTPEELREAVWPGQAFVDSDHGIRTAINKIRAALDDQALNPRFVETLPRHGYRFIAPVTRGGLATLAATPITSSPAGQAFLKGTYGLSRSAGGLVTGIEQFRESIALDPKQPASYVGLALLHLQMGFGYGPLTPAECWREARSAALRALELDATVADAIACLAWVRSFGEWQWNAADREFRSALQLDPASVEVHRLYSWHLSAMERFEEAIRHARRAYDLNPASLQCGYSLAAAYHWSRQHQLERVEAERLAQVDPTFPGAFRLVGGARLQEGATDEAIEALERANVLSGKEFSTWGAAYLAYAYAVGGRETEARHVLARLERHSETAFVSPYLFAVVQTGLGNEAEGLDWLERGFAQKDPMLAFLRVDFQFDSLRAQQRFHDLVRRMNFPS